MYISVHTFQIISRKMTACVYQFFLYISEQWKNVVQTDHHHDLFVEVVDAFVNWVGDSDFSLDPVTWFYNNILVNQCQIFELH